MDILVIKWDNGCKNILQATKPYTNIKSLSNTNIKISLTSVDISKGSTDVFCKIPNLRRRENLYVTLAVPWNGQSCSLLAISL